MTVRRTKFKTPVVSKQITGNIGLFYVCYELACRGFTAVPTSRKTNTVDVIVANNNFSRPCTVQVRTSTNLTNSATIVKTSKCKTKQEALAVSSLADFWVHVVLDPENQYEVLHVFIWEGANEELILENDADWIFPTQRVATRNIWKRYKNDRGWQLITDHLTGKTK